MFFVAKSFYQNGYQHTQNLQFHQRQPNSYTHQDSSRSSSQCLYPSLSMGDYVNFYAKRIDIPQINTLLFLSPSPNFLEAKMFHDFCQRQQQKINTVQQSLECIKSTTLSVLSTIAYLRDLFPESAFYQHSFAQLPLKKIKRGIMSEADSFLDWIEKGCFDAINRNYLKCIVFAIYCNQSKLT